MLRDRKIAVFIDVDNCPLQFINYENALNELSKMGEIVCVKLYGVNERKHKEIVEHATNHGYDTLLGMRVKKRGAKVFDGRITADVLEAVFTMPNIDAVAIVAAPSDTVYLYRMLHKYDIAVIAYDNGDEFTSNLIDEKLDLGIVELLPPPKKTAKPRAKAEQPKATVAAQPKATVVAEQPKVVEEQPATLAEQANELLHKVHEIREEKAVETKPVEEAVASQATRTPVVQYVEEEEEEVVEEPVAQQPAKQPVKVVEEQPEVVVAEPVVGVDQEIAHDSDFVKDLEKTYDSVDDDESDATAFLEKLNKILKDE